MTGIKSTAVAMIALLADEGSRAAKAGEYEQYRDMGKVAQLGPRPYFLIHDMARGELKEKLEDCAVRLPILHRTAFSIGHRGACLQFPEHTLESYLAAARMGAGIIECDVTFTKDAELVCRHSQCDLHTTTDILRHDDLRRKCTRDFQPAQFNEDGTVALDDNGDPLLATAACCTSDITLEEFRRLKGKMDAANPLATTVTDYVKGSPGFQTDLYSGPSSGTLMTHAESAKLFKTLGVGVTPELKTPSVAMPFDADGDGTGDFTYDDYRQKLINELRVAGIRPGDAWVQSFVREDIDYWIANEPDFARQAVYLIPADNPSELQPFLAGLPSYRGKGINYVAPPMWALVEAENGKLVPSEFATTAKNSDLKIITWTFERSGILADGEGGYYYQTAQDVLADRRNEGVALELLDVLTQEVGIEGIFSDWPATVTFYANCVDGR